MASSSVCIAWSVSADQSGSMSRSDSSCVMAGGVRDPPRRRYGERVMVSSAWRCMYEVLGVSRLPLRRRWSSGIDDGIEVCVYMAVRRVGMGHRVGRIIGLEGCGLIERMICVVEDVRGMDVACG